MPAPADADAVLAAIRLGWCVAEVRGRNRSGVLHPPERLASRTDYALPLEGERSRTELRLNAQAVLIALADKVGVDAGPEDGSYSREVARRADDLMDLRVKGADDAAAWGVFAELIYRFDAHIQANLSVTSDLQAGGYQLGRALAECYWALDPSLPEEGPTTAASWSFLLGPLRCAQIVDLLGRLSTYMPSYTARAIEGSVRKWQDVADSPRWRRNAIDYLYGQVRTWYELAALGRDPYTYVRSYQRLRNSRIINRAIQFFWAEMLVVAVGVASLIVLVVLVGSGSGTAVINTVLAILAAAGVSTAGLSAGRFRRDLNTDLLIIAITKLPPRPQ